MASPPLVLESDELEVTLLPEHGGRLHRIRAFGVDLLRTPGDAATHGPDPFFWGAYVMAPWCNRARTGPMEVAGRTVHLAPNFPDGTAIHGQVYGRPWQIGDDGSLAVRGGGGGWPWEYDVRLRPRLDGATLGLALELANRSDGPMPGGIGLHPWFRRPVHVGVVAATVVPDNGDPAARPVPVAGDLMLVPDRPPRDGLDGTWLDADPRAVQLRWPDDGLAATFRIEADAPVHVAVASPADLDAVAVEPVTHVPWALDRMGAGDAGALTLLGPGETTTLGLTLEVRRT
jgi:aldose 1-epimerase